MRAIEATPVWNIIKKIIQNKSSKSKYQYVGKFHTKLIDREVFKILTIDDLRDYASRLCPYVQIEILIGLGDYVYDFYPFRHNLEFSISRRLVNEVTGGGVPNKDTLIERYKVVFLSELNPEPVGSEYARMSQQMLNTKKVISVKIQLLNRSFEPLRIKAIGGCFRDCSYQDLIRASFETESVRVLVDGQPSISMIDIVEPDNKTIMKNIVLKQGLKLTSLPSFLQNNLAGVYNAGIGTFIQRYKEKMGWYIYPLYRQSRVGSNIPNMIFYTVPTERYQGSEYTHLTEGNTTHVLISGNKEFSDSAEVDFMVEGSGFRLTDPRSFMTKPVEMTNDGPVGLRHRVNTEVLMLSREDGLDYSPVTKSAMSVNAFKEYSDVLSRSGSVINLSWQYSDPDLIYPGMNCKIAYLEENTVKYRVGVILQTHSYTALGAVNANSKNHITTTAVSIFLEKEKS